MSEIRKDITAVILAGGKSSRMGAEKSLIKINDETLIERSVSISKKYFDRIIISTNDAAKYRFCNLDCVADIYPNLGPISGIHSGLVNSSTNKIFVYSVDIVFGDERLLKEIIEHPTRKQIILPLFEEIPQYTFGIYSLSILQVIEEMILSDDKPTPRKLIKKVEAELIDFKNCDYFDEAKFINLNTPADYEIAKQIFEKGNNL